uniref:TIR domain-containing adapter molecule 1-like n=1 Tax=Neolamprologus brichardi TaxID=32507 RepID=A0A3Q4HQU9_NEOBR
MLLLISEVLLKMSLKSQANHGTGLRDVFDLLVKTPSERLLSLTFQLGDSPEDKIIHALCLIVLDKEVEALDKLQMLTDSSLAKHVAEKCQMRGGNLEDFGSHCGLFEALTGESLAELAHVFKVLTEQRLCDPLLRNLAYKRALSSDCVKTRNGNDLELYNYKFLEEAKNVCGPECAEWMSPSSDQRAEPDSNLLTSSLPSPLSANLPSIVKENRAQNVTEPPQSSEAQPETTESPPFDPKQDSSKYGTPAAAAASLMSNESDTKSDNQTKTPSPKLPKTSVPGEIHESKAVEEEEEEIFYAFVILHAPEDSDMAESIKEKIEAVIGGEFEGATFSDFSIPGKTTIKSMEDAINNSAFTLLLLTRNFNTCMLDLKANAAFVNSINKAHKYNTVIPLLPRENCMPKQDMPMVLQGVNPLEERKNFEKKIQKSLLPAKIKRQRWIWKQEKAQKQTMKHLNKISNLTISVEPNLRPGPPTAAWHPQPNIHIENANYIMIGNDSRMNVDLGGNANREDSN